MKRLITTILIMASAIGIWLVACKKSDGDSDTQASLAYSPTESVAGKTIAQWTANWYQWVYSANCTDNPFTDKTGAKQSLNQSGSVYFLAGTLGDTVVRAVTIPAGKNILIPIVNYMADYPCPDTSFHPAAGETLEHYLTTMCKTNIDIADVLSFTVDGVVFTNLSTYRAASGLFNFTGNISLQTCLDNCVTGSPQQAAADGYWIMLKPLSAGMHTVHLIGGITSAGFRVDVTYNLTVQ